MGYVVIARWTAKDGEEGRVADAIGRLIGPSRAEPGNRAYECLRDPDNARLFVLYERYDDAAAYAAHGASEHFRLYATELAIPLLESREREFYTTWDGA